MTSTLRQEIARATCGEACYCRRGECLSWPALARADLIIARVLDACEPVTDEMVQAWTYASMSPEPEWADMLAAKRRELLGGEK